MNEYTLEITSYCPHECAYCSTNASRDGKHISFETIRQFLAQQNVKPGDRVNISGGEPLAHPRFWDILNLCKSKTDDVWVYTNALKNIRYNSSIVKEINCEANVCLVPGDTAYIPETATKIHLLQLVSQGRAKGIHPANIHVCGIIGNRETCKACNHLVLQADGQVVNGPCRKNYI